jgi:hypothetical protein
MTAVNHESDAAEVGAILIAPITVVVALMSKGDGVAVAVVALLLVVGVLFDRTGIMVNIALTSYVMLAVGKDMWLQIAMSWLLLSSLKSINVSCRMMPKIRLNRDGLNDGVQQLEIPRRNLVG